MRLELATFSTNAGAPVSSATLSGGLMSQWRVGAIVEAIAVRDASDGRLWLDIGTTRVPARVASGDAAGPANGEHLQLRVLRDSPVLALETLAADDLESNTVGDALRRYLPRQASPAPLLANMAWLNTHPDAVQQLGKPIADALQRLWQALPDATQLQTPEGLAAAVKRSGAFLEANLAHSDPGDVQQLLNRDLKSLLLTIKQTLQRSGATSHISQTEAPGPLPTLRGPLLPLDDAPPGLPALGSSSQQLSELGSQADGALARITSTQLANSAAAHAGAGAWLLELPLRRNEHPEMLRFRFERNSQQSSAEQSWTVEAALTLGTSGALHARISLYGRRIGVQLRAEPPQLVAELNARAPLLTSMLSDAGLAVDRIVCLHGMPNEDRAARTAALLDVRA